MTTGKTIALTRQTFADKVMSVLFNMLSRFITDFLPRSRLQSLSTVILEPEKIKSITVSIVSIILQLKMNLIVKKKSFFKKKKKKFDDSLFRTHIPVKDTVPFTPKDS